VTRGLRPPPWPLGLWLVLLLAVGASFPYAEQVGNANENPRILQALARIDDGEWWIDEQRRRGIRLGPDTARGPDGHLYPNKPPGTTLAAMLGVAGARAVAYVQHDAVTLRDVTWWARLFGGVLPTLWLAVALLRRHSMAFGLPIAAAAGLLLVIGTPLDAYSHVLYGHALAAALLQVGLVRLVPALVEPGLPPHRNTDAFLGGMLAGAAVAVEYAAAFAAIPIGIAVIVAMRREDARGPGVAAVLGALVPVGLLARYHAHAFGSPWATGYHHATDPEFAAKHAQGLLGLSWPSVDGVWTHVLTPDTGLLWWAPTCVLAIIGLVLLVRAPGPRRFEGALHLGLVAVFLWVVTSLSFEGGWRIGPRYFVLALPSLVMGWCAWLARIRSNTGLVVLTVALATFAVVQNGLAANLWPHIDPTGVDAPLPELLLPLWRGELRPYAVFGIRPGLDLVEIVMASSVIAIAIAIARAVDTSVRNLVAGVLGLVGGLVLVQACELLPRNPKAERNLAYVQRVWEPKGDTEAPSIEIDPAPAPDVAVPER